TSLDPEETMQLENMINQAWERRSSIDTSEHMKHTTLNGGDRRDGNGRNNNRHKMTPDFYVTAAYAKSLC
ncbi:MAG: hypothetical protein AAF329_25910, partial [Cyanobacteria bacterium P01_A01_bin.17]